jgi:hypothetical protein
MKISIINQEMHNISNLCKSLVESGVTLDYLNNLSYESIREAFQYTRCIILVTDTIKDFCRVSECCKNQPGVQVIGISVHSPIWFLDKLADNGSPDHIVNMNMPEFENWIIANLSKLSYNNFSGIQFYTKPDLKTWSDEINDSKLKDRYINMVLSRISQNNFRGRLLNDIEQILDEMITNAIYNAPVDESGVKLYQQRSRSESVVLSDEQTAILSYAIDDKKIYLSVKDPFGSLTKEQLLTYLSKCYKEDHIYVENKKGGAGIGLHKILRLSHNFVVNIDPGNYTEVISCISLNPVQQNQETASINIFVKENKNA